MAEWFSASELAGLPGLPGSDRGVERRAMREAWLRQRRAGRGGGFEFHISSLPSETQAHLKGQRAVTLVQQSPAAKAGAIEGAKLELKERIETDAARTRRIEALKKSASLNETAQRRIDAKLAILGALERYHQASALPIDKAEEQFAQQYSAGRIALDDAVHELISEVSARTLRRWRNDMKRDGLTRLAGGYGNRKGAGKIDSQPAVRDLIVGLLVAKPHARASHVMQALRARFADAELPSLRSIERWMADWKSANAQTFAAISNPDAWKNQYMTAFGSQSEGVARLNQRWELDSTPADVMLTDGRHAVLGVIDVRSRRAKLFVAKTSRATAIAALTRRALLDWGVPEEAKTDNGTDYTGHHVTRVFKALDIRHTLCPPFQPWHKPHVESFFRTFSHDLVELLDGFIGHNVAERKSIEARVSFADRLMKRGEAIEVRMSAAEFQQFCDRWCDDIYAHRPHDGLDGKTPFEMVSACRDRIARITDERALDILLSEAPDNHGMRTVQKKGVKIDEAWFIAPELEAFVGQQVQVKHDAIEHDLGRVYVFGGPDLQFICIAECPERTGIDRREVAIRARETQKRRVQEERRALKAVAKAVRTDDIVDDILRGRAVASGKLAIFPKPAEAHESAGLAAAVDAAEALRAPTRATADLTTNDEFAAARARLEAEAQRPVQPIFNTPFERAYWIASQAMERPLTDEERDYLDRFRKENPRSARDLDEMLTMRFGAQHGPAAAG